MSEKRYTLTLYIAPPGGIIKHKDNKGNVIKTETSSVGHVYYAISEDGGIHKKGYGFSPTVSSPIFTGHAVANEQDLYTNPAYKRTIEISKEQYDKLKAFGEASLSTNHAKKISELTNGKFNTMVYNAGNNSCVDYVYHALRYSGVYDHKVTIIERTNELNEYGEIIHKPIRESDDGRLNVLNNATIFDKIPVAPQYKQKNNDIYKIEDNKYYNSIEEVKKKVPFYLKVENNFINNDVGRIQNASNKNFDLLQETNNLLARLKSGDQTALSDFMGRDDVRQIQRESAMTAQAFLSRNPGFGEEMLPNRFQRLGMEDMSERFRNLYKDSRKQLAGYYQEQGIRYREEALDNTAAALAAAGCRSRMKCVSMISVADGQVNIGDESFPDFRTASVNARNASLTGMQESMESAQRTEREFEEQARQREMERMAQSHSRGMSIG